MTYCERCTTNFGDEGFDYRFSYPVCHDCVRTHNLQPDEEN